MCLVLSQMSSVLENRTQSLNPQCRWGSLKEKCFGLYCKDQQPLMILHFLFQRGSYCYTQCWLINQCSSFCFFWIVQPDNTVSNVTSGEFSQWGLIHCCMPLQNTVASVHATPGWQGIVATLPRTEYYEEDAVTAVTMVHFLLLLFAVAFCCHLLFIVTMCQSRKLFELQGSPGVFILYNSDSPFKLNSATLIGSPEL